MLSVGSYTLDLPPVTDSEDWLRRDLLWTAGFLSFYSTFIVRCCPRSINFSLIYLVLSRFHNGSVPDTWYLSNDFVTQCDQEAAGVLGPWLKMDEDASSPTDVVRAMANPENAHIQHVIMQYGLRQVCADAYHNHWLY